MRDIALSDDQYNKIVKLAGLYYQEAKKCRKCRAFLPGCIMIGAAFEAMLLSFINNYIEEASISPKVPRGKGGAVKPLIEWNLSNLMAVVKERGWLPSNLSLEDEWDDANAQIGDYGEVIRYLRNLIHPARYASDLIGKRISKRYLDTCFDILSIARDYLNNQINKSLLNA